MANELLSRGEDDIDAGARAAEAGHGIEPDGRGAVDAAGTVRAHGDIGHARGGGVEGGLNLEGGAAERTLGTPQGIGRGEDAGPL